MSFWNRDGKPVHLGDYKDKVFPNAGFIVLRQGAYKERPAKDRTIRAEEIMEVQDCTTEESGSWLQKSDGRWVKVEESVAEILAMIELCKIGAVDGTSD